MAAPVRQSFDSSMIKSEQVCQSVRFPAQSLGSPPWTSSFGQMKSLVVSARRSEVQGWLAAFRGQVNYREFRKGCREFGYAGDVHSLFRALDVERSGVLTLDQVTTTSTSASPGSINRASKSRSRVIEEPSGPSTVDS
eukprot:3006859-Amphidinium_carterae.1